MKVKFLLVILLVLLIASAQFESGYQRIPSPTTETEAIYIVSHGWHTGFVVPAIAMQSRLPALKQRFKNTPYLEIGWGDKGFYQANEVTSGLTLQAMFWSIGSVIHVVAVPEKVKRYFSKVQVEKLCLTPEQHTALIQFITDSFYKDRNGQIVARQWGRYGDSQFYEATETYHIFNTCNKWVARGLQCAGMAIDPILKLTAGSVMEAVEAQVANSHAASCYQKSESK
jgi:uncharacterized protein (TIGR02117 family)